MRRDVLYEPSPPIVLSGQVLTRPVPPQGKLIELRARPVRTRWSSHGARRHRTTTYGPWKTFAVPRANSKDGYSFAYTFKQQGPHTYQIQAVAPHEGGYANKEATQLVHER